MSLISIEGSADRPPADVSRNRSANNEDEPPSHLRPPLFLLGRDSCGHWVAQNPAGTRGGLFVDRAQALRYIRFEGGNHALVTDTSLLELNPARLPQAPFDFSAPRARLVA